MPRYQRLIEGEGALKICPLHQGDILALPNPTGRGSEAVTDHEGVGSHRVVNELPVADPGPPRDHENVQRPS